MIVTLEARFLPAVRKALGPVFVPDTTPDPVYELVRTRPHLWPFFIAPMAGQLFMPPLGQCDEPRTLAFVNHSRWITRCPYCPSAQHAAESDLWFFCAGCTNSFVGNLSIPVVWPHNRAEIEAVLLERPFLPTRNWEPHETVDNLRAENARYLPLERAGALV